MSNDNDYRSESEAAGWFVGIIMALALLAIGYLIFSSTVAVGPIG